MAKLTQTYKDLRFTPEQLYFTDVEYASLAKEFFGNAGPKDAYTNRDRAFLQAALFIAIDTSEKTKLLFDMWSSFVSAAPSASMKKLLQKLVHAGAKYTFSAYVDNSPKYSAAGRAGVQYSAFGTQWRTRVGAGDISMLDNFLKYGD